MTGPKKKTAAEHRAEADGIALREIARLLERYEEQREALMETRKLIRNWRRYLLHEQTIPPPN